MTQTKKDALNWIWEYLVGSQPEKDFLEYYNEGEDLERYIKNYLIEANFDQDTEKDKIGAFWIERGRHIFMGYDAVCLLRDLLNDYINDQKKILNEILKEIEDHEEIIINMKDPNSYAEFDLSYTVEFHTDSDIEDKYCIVIDYIEDLDNVFDFYAQIEEKMESKIESYYFRLMKCNCSKKLNIIETWYDNFYKNHVEYCRACGYPRGVFYVDYLDDSDDILDLLHDKTIEITDEQREIIRKCYE